MKTLLSSLCLCLALLPGGAVGQSAPAETELQRSATDFLGLLIAGDFAAAVQTFDAKMTEVFPEARLTALWSTVLSQAGAYQAQTGIRLEKVQGYDAVIVTCAFAQLALDIRVVFDSERHIAGLFFAPAQAVDSSPASYVDKTKFSERELQVGDDEWALPATLSLPQSEALVPALVLVHGSGPNDRDETIGPNKIFRDLAWGLASQGIAVLRYEKRTLAHGGKLSELNLPFTVQEETAEDALRAVALLRAQREIDPKQVYVLGHSLGGMLIPRIGAGDAAIAGLISMAGPTRPLQELMQEQFDYIFGLDGSVSAEEASELKKLQDALAQIEALQPADANSTQDLYGVPASYWWDLREYDPAEQAKSLPQRLLILQGERDYQVTMVDFQSWQTALANKGNCVLKSYPTLNHLFIAGEGKSTPAEYQTAGHVAPEVISDIVNWIRR